MSNSRLLDLPVASQPAAMGPGGSHKDPKRILKGPKWVQKGPEGSRLGSEGSQMHLEVSQIKIMCPKMLTHKMNIDLYGSII